MLSIIKKPTPNFTVGREGFKPEAIVIHIMSGTLLGTDAWFASPASGVSAHYGISQNGEVHQYVKEEDQAYHAGGVSLPTWKYIKTGVNPNMYTVGIEHEGFEYSSWSEIMKQASAELVSGISKRWNIPLDRDHVIGHYEIRSTKPNCPAIDKSIINDIIARAAKFTAPADEIICIPCPKSKVDRALAFIKSI